MSIAAWRQQATARLSDALGIDAISCRLEADILLGHVLGCSRSWLFAHADDPLEAATLDTLDTLIRRREAGEPIAYLTGIREFRSREYQVSDAVLVPRDDTEVLVEATLACVHSHLQSQASCRASCRVLEVGTGSGIVATSLALETARDPVFITATDIDAAALDIAIDNAGRLGARVQFAQADWLSAIGTGSVDIICSNPPYIAARDPHLEALHREPTHALVSGGDGLDAIRTLIDTGLNALAEDGYLLLEHGHDQQPAVVQLFADAGYIDITHHRDLAGHVRVSCARMRR